jgi:hypothetical protein
MRADQMEWNAEAGLYRRSGPGHTRPVAASTAVHSLPETFIAFAVDAQLGRLDTARFHRALEALDRMQVREPDSPLNGCLRWYLEEPHPVDTNASFFIGLTILFIERAYGGLLPAQTMALLRRVFTGLSEWFTAELQTAKLYYPNKYLGDLTCAWLLAESLGRDDQLAALQSRLGESLKHWRDTHWGWGEHLSQVYSTVMLTEISLLLLLQRALPGALQAELTDTARALLRIHDFYAGGAWTPTIRCYAFDGPPVPLNYRDEVRAWHPEADAEFLAALPRERFMRVSFAHYLHQAGWHDLFPAENTPHSAALVLPCGNGVSAVARKAGRWRTGCLSRFPLCKEWDNLHWGLSWQTFPACFAHGRRIWGFAQWRVQWKDGTVRCHPAEEKDSAYLGNALTPDKPVLTGNTTSSHTPDGVMMISRRMPDRHPGWDAMADRWTVFLPDRAAVSRSERDGWQLLTLHAPDGDLHLMARDDPALPAVQLHRGAGVLHFTRPLPLDATPPRTDWAVALAAPGSAPEIPDLNDLP